MLHLPTLTLQRPVQLVAALVLLVISGCASQAEKVEKPAAQGVVNPLNQASAQQLANGCDGMTSTTTTPTGTAAGTGFGLFNQGSVKLPGRDMYFFIDRQETQRKNLCQILKDSGRKVAVVQFAGVECGSCRTEATMIQQRIAAAGGQDILHVLVMTDFLVDFPNESQFQAFKTELAQNSTMVYDESVYWKAFQKNPQVPDRSLVIAMNLNMDGFVINDNQGVEFSQIDRIFVEAKRLANQ